MVPNLNLSLSMENLNLKLVLILKNVVLLVAIMTNKFRLDRYIGYSKIFVRSLLRSIFKLLEPVCFTINSCRL